MLRIEKDTDGCVTKLRLSGRITLVDLGVVRFLISCEDDGIELEQCPVYVREWMFRERAEGVESDSSDAG